MTTDYLRFFQKSILLNFGNTADGLSYIYKLQLTIAAFSTLSTILLTAVNPDRGHI